MERLKNKHICIDTMILIELLEGGKHSLQIKQIFEKSQMISASCLVFLESAVGFFKQKRIDIIEIIEQLPIISKNFNFIPIEMEICRKAAQLRAKYNIKTPDSIHLATALHSNADIFLTEDKSLKRIKELNIMTIKNLSNIS